MSQGRNFILSASIAVALAGCVSTPAPGPVEVTRFHDASALDTLGRGTIFVQDALGNEEAALELAPYKAAIAAERVAVEIQVVRTALWPDRFEN